jgi:sulfur transfer protein SufE
MSILAKELEIIEELEMFDDWQEKFGYVIDHGKNIAELEDQYRIREYRSWLSKQGVYRFFIRW